MRLTHCAALLIALALLTSSCARLRRLTSHDNSNSSINPQARTNLERFAAQTGSVLIKGYTHAGEISGSGGTVGLVSYEFTDARTNQKAYGIAVELRETGALQRSENAFIDYDEIDSLIQGIDYIGRTNSSITRLENFEASYSTKGLLTVTVFGSQSGLQFVVKIGYVSALSVYFPLGRLGELRNLIVAAKDSGVIVCVS